MLVPRLGRACMSVEVDSKLDYAVNSIPTSKLTRLRRYKGYTWDSEGAVIPTAVNAGKYLLVLVGYRFLTSIGRHNISKNNNRNITIKNTLLLYSSFGMYGVLIQPVIKGPLKGRKRPSRLTGLGLPHQKPPCASRSHTLQRFRRCATWN